jgi:hypothetical protein
MGLQNSGKCSKKEVAIYRGRNYDNNNNFQITYAASVVALVGVSKSFNLVS